MGNGIYRKTVMPRAYACAERLRIIAAADGNRQNRELLERVADDYERMTRDAEARDRSGKTGSV